MPIHHLKLLDRYEVADNTIVLVFEKPPHIVYTPGQYAGFTLINPHQTDPTASGGMTRRFSLLSIPDDPHIAIVTRVQQSIFKQELNKLPIGKEIKFAGPIGSFILHHDQTIPAVLIAGGIGIAPFFSIIRHASKHCKNQAIQLFYGNQRREDTAFLTELSKIQQEYPQFKMVVTLEQPDDDWRGEKGYITDKMIKNHVSALSQSYYYICGSPAMVSALQKTLTTMGIDEHKILVEDFPGY